MNRIDGWELALNQYLASVKEIPFGWGTNDCCLFAANWGLILLGVDYMEPFRGQYTNEQEAKAFIDSQGNVRIALNNRFEPCNKAMARRGDLVMYQEALGVCNGIYSFFMTSEGLRPIRTSMCTNAWKLGE